MSRITARKHAFILIFQAEFHEEDYYEELVQRYMEEVEDVEKITKSDKTFIENEFQNTMLHKDAIDKLIDKCSVSWSVSRLSKVDLAILRLCINEIMFFEDIPEKVSINEAIELAKEFSSDEAPTFINGVLGKISDGKEILQ